MALSAVNYQGTGTLTDFGLNFTLGYLRKEHIHAYIKPANTVDFVEDTKFIFINQDTGIRFNTAPPAGSTVQIRRITPNNSLLHDYENGSLVIEKNLDESNKQAVMLMHEAIDGFTDVGAGSDLDMGGLRITNLGDPLANGDAVNFKTFNIAVPQIKAARDQGVAAVQAQETTSVNAVNTEGTTQIIALGIIEDSVQASEAAVDADRISVEATKSDFDSKYIGEVVTLPDPNLHPEGALAFLTGVGLRLIKDSIWVAASTAVETIRSETEFSNAEGNLSASQTVFTVAHDAGFIDVIYNGSVLTPQKDFTSNGTSVTLTLAVTDYLTDTVVIRAWGNISQISSVTLDGIIDDKVARVWRHDKDLTEALASGDWFSLSADQHGFFVRTGSTVTYFIGISSARSLHAQGLIHTIPLGYRPTPGSQNMQFPSTKRAYLGSTSPSDDQGRLYYTEANQSLSYYGAYVPSGSLLQNIRMCATWITTDTFPSDVDIIVN